MKWQEEAMTNAEEETRQIHLKKAKELLLTLSNEGYWSDPDGIQLANVNIIKKIFNPRDLGLSIAVGILLEFAEYEFPQSGGPGKIVISDDVMSFAATQWNNYIFHALINNISHGYARFHYVEDQI